MAFYVKDNRPLAAAGTRNRQIAAFIDRMRTGQLPSADELRSRASVDLFEGLKCEASVRKLHTAKASVQR